MELTRCRPPRVVFRDANLMDSAARINVEQIFELWSPDSDVNCI